MILPDNGKVVIIDDKISEVEGLMAGLSAEKVPFVYYQKVDGSDLPAEPVENVRLIFLDLLLIDETKGQTAKKIIAPVVARFRKILKKNNGPYVLIYWSNKEAEYKAALEEEFNGALTDYKPLLSLSLDKKYSGDMNAIKQNLNTAYNTQFGALNAFLFWESLVNKSGGDVVNEFAGFDLPGATKDASLKNILYKLAKAVDENRVDALGDEEKMKKAFDPVSEVLLDVLYANIENSKWPGITGIVNSGSGGDDKYIANINARLHLKELVSANDKKILTSGNIYTIAIDATNTADVDEMFKNSIDRNGTDISSKTFILLDVSPQCDYSLGKLQCIRFLPGILFEQPATSLKINNSDSRYHQCPPFCIGGKIYGMFFDFRYLKSEPVEAFRAKNVEATYRIGTKLLADIQAKLARHINRPGITSVK